MYSAFCCTHKTTTSFLIQFLLLLLKIMRAFTLIVLFFSSLYIEAQTTIILQENFTNYLGTAATVPTGWNFSYNGNYTSVSFSGASGPNAYKFGTNGARTITPKFSNADSVLFWLKGSATD